MTLEQYLLSAPPPRRLRGSLINDSPTGASLRWIALFQLFCLAVAPLPYLLSEPTRKELNDFLLILAVPPVWLGLWLAACIALIFYSRHLRGRFWLAEQGRAVQGTVYSVSSYTKTVWVYYAMVSLEQFTFVVELPGGHQRAFVTEGETPGNLVPTVGPGDPVTVLVHEDKIALLGLEALDNGCALLRKSAVAWSKANSALACVALVAVVFFALYTMQCCVILDAFARDLLWPCLTAAVVGSVGLFWWQRRPALLLAGAVLGPLFVLAAFYFVNCWLDFTPPEWREGRLESRRTKSLSAQLPIQLGELQLLVDGTRFRFGCRPSRLDTYGSVVQVRVNRGLLGYRWAGAVR